MTSQPGGSSSNSSNKPETVIAMKPEVAANDSGSSPKVNFSISKFDILFFIIDFSFFNKQRNILRVKILFNVWLAIFLIHHRFLTVYCYSEKSKQLLK